MSDQNITINDEFLLDQGQTLFRSAKSGQELLLERMKKNMDLYDGIFSEKERKYSEFLGADRLFINKTYTNVQRIAVDVMEAFFNDPDEIVSVKTYKSIPYESLEIVKALLNYRLNSHPIDGYKEIYEATIDAIRTMYCVFKVYPRLRTEKVPVPAFQRVLLPTGQEIDFAYEREEEKITAYEPALECLPPEDVLFAANATWKDYWKKPLVHTYWKSRDELKSLGFKNVDAMPGGETTDDSTNVVKYQRTSQYHSPFTQQTNVEDQKMIRVFEFWDLLPYKNEGLQSCSYKLIGDKNGPVYVGKGWELNELPYKMSDFEPNRPPIVLGFAYPEPHRLPGKAYPEITEALQKETNAQRNQEREAVARDLRPTLYVNKEAEVDLMSLMQRRISGYVQGNGPASNAITQIQTSSTVSVLAQSQARTDNDYAENGLPPNLLGASTGEDTATGQTQQLANANKKIAFVLKNIAYTGILPAFQMLLRLEQTYCSDEFINMVTGRVLGWRVGDDGFPARDAIQGDFDLQVSTGINKQAQVNRLLLVMDRMTQHNAGMAQLVQLGIVPIQETKFANPMKLFEHFLSINGLKNVSDYQLQALPPAPTQGDVPGIASQSGNLQDAGDSISQTNPAAPEVFSLAG